VRLPPRGRLPLCTTRPLSNRAIDYRIIPASPSTAPLSARVRGSYASPDPSPRTPFPTPSPTSCCHPLSLGLRCRLPFSVYAMPPPPLHAATAAPSPSLHYRSFWFSSTAVASPPHGHTSLERSAAAAEARGAYYPFSFGPLVPFLLWSSPNPPVGTAPRSHQTRVRHFVRGAAAVAPGAGRRWPRRIGRGRRR
jgi:hypothetical protein